jgi:hypothetical protein
MRYTESVKDPDYERVIIRMRRPPTSGPVVPYEPPLTDLSRDDVRIAADKIMEAFCWSETPEGEEFWDSVYRRLIQISDTGDHRE